MDLVRRLPASRSPPFSRPARCMPTTSTVAAYVVQPEVPRAAQHGLGLSSSNGLSARDAAPRRRARARTISSRLPPPPFVARRRRRTTTVPTIEPRRIADAAERPPRRAARARRPRPAAEHHRDRTKLTIVASHSRPGRRRRRRSTAGDSPPDAAGRRRRSPNLGTACGGRSPARAAGAPGRTGSTSPEVTDGGEAARAATRVPSRRRRLAGKRVAHGRGGGVEGVDPLAA